MSKNLKETWKHFKKDSTSIWAIVWACLNVAWLIFINFKVNGLEKAAEAATEKLVFGLLPFLVSAILLFVYHYLRSDLYLERNKPEIGRSLIPGRLLQMVEFWKPEPKKMLGGTVEYKAYQTLLTYRVSYEFDYIHSEIEEFLKAFKISGNIIVPEIRTIFTSATEAQKAFPRLKELAKQIGKEIT